MILLGRFLKEGGRRSERGRERERERGIRRAAANELRRKTDANIISRATRERSAIESNRAIWVNFFLGSRKIGADGSTVRQSWTWEDGEKSWRWG